MDRKSEAVRGCVSVIAAACGQDEEIMAKWLELYYVVRDTEDLAAPDPAAATAHMGNHYGANAKAYKQQTRERLLAMRKNGLGMDRLLKAAGGKLTEREVTNILQAVHMPVDVYRALAAVLDKIEETAGDL